MASKKVSAPKIATPQIIEPVGINLLPTAGGNAIFRAWRFLFQVFGARATGFEVDEDTNGITINGFMVEEPYDAETIIRDITQRGDKAINPTLELFPSLYWLNGLDPLPYTAAQELTHDLTRFFHGSEGGEGNRSPKYAKDGIALYKNRMGFAVPRGRPRKSVTIRIGELNEDALKDLPQEEITSLRTTLENLQPA
jgi:hypothetical protein